MLDIKEFGLEVSKQVGADEFEKQIKDYCSRTGKQFYAVMNAIVNHKDAFSEIHLVDESSTVKITLSSYFTGKLEITRENVLLHKK